MMNFAHNLIAAIRCRTLVSRLSVATSNRTAQNQPKWNDLAPPIAFVPHREGCS